MANTFWLGTASNLGGSSASSYPSYYNFPYNPRDFTPPRPLKFVSRVRTWNGELITLYGTDTQGEVIPCGFTGIQSAGSGYSQNFWDNLEGFRLSNVVPLYFSWDNRGTIVPVVVLTLEGNTDPVASAGGGPLYRNVKLTLVRR